MSRRSPLARLKHLSNVMEIDAINLRDEEAAAARSLNPEGRAALLDEAWRRFSASLQAMEDETTRLKQELFAYVYSASNVRDKEMRAVAKGIVGAQTASIQRRREIFAERRRRRVH